MTEYQIAVFSGVLLLAAIALFLFLGYLWGQRRKQNGSQEVYTEQEHDIELKPISNHVETKQNVDTFDDTIVLNTDIAGLYNEKKHAEKNYVNHNDDTPMAATESMSPTDLKVKSKLYHYTAHVTNVYDGDTITVDIDLGMGIWQRDVRIRLWRINTSEVRGSEREQGLAVRDFVRRLVLERDILLRTILDKRGQDRTGKYGRLLGEVLIEDNSGRMLNVNQLLLDKGLAQPVAADGSMPTPAAAPAPIPSFESAEGVVPQFAEYIACIYCGEVRSVDHVSGQIASCSNCFDEAFAL